MAAFGVLHGARVKLGFFDGQQFNPVGLFSDVSYGVSYDVQGAWILGRYTAAATEYVAQDLIHVNATGYRIVNHSWYADAKMPKLQNLANAGYLMMQMEDRQSGKTVGTIKKLRPATASGGFSPRSLSAVTHTYIGILWTDENAEDNDEGPGAMSLPDA